MALGCLIVYLNTKTIANSIIMYNVWWCSVVSFSTLGISGLFIPSDYTYFIIFLGTLGFNFAGILFYRNKRYYVTSNISYRNKPQSDVRLWLYYLLQIITTIFLIPYFLRGLMVTTSQGMATLRALQIDDPLEQLKIFWFSEPVLVASMILSSFLYLSGQSKIWILIPVLINTILFAFSFGGRIVFFWLIFFFIFAWLFIRKNNFQKKAPSLTVSKKIWGILIVTILISTSIWIMLYITKQRSPNTSLISTISIYFFGSFTMLDILLHNPELSMLHAPLMLGRATLGGLVDTIILFAAKALGIFGLTTQHMAVNQINSVTSKPHYVGNGIWMNAFSTMYYPYLRDFGVFGAFLVPFLLGLALCLVRKILYSHRCLLWYSIYSIMCFCCLFSTNRWEFVHFWPWGTIFFVFMLTKSSHVNNKKIIHTS